MLAKVNKLGIEQTSHSPPPTQRVHIKRLPFTTKRWVRAKNKNLNHRRLRMSMNGVGGDRFGHGAVAIVRLITVVGTIAIAVSGWIVVIIADANWESNQYMVHNASGNDPLTAQTSGIDLTMEPQQESAVDELGEDVQNPIEDRLGIGCDDIATFRESPADWIQEPQEDQVRTKGAVGFGDIWAESGRVLASGHQNDIGDPKQASESKGEVAPLRGIVSHGLLWWHGWRHTLKEVRVNAPTRPHTIITWFTRRVNKMVGHGRAAVNSRDRRSSGVVMNLSSWARLSFTPDPKARTNRCIEPRRSPARSPRPWDSGDGTGPGCPSGPSRSPRKSTRWSRRGWRRWWYSGTPGVDVVSWTSGPQRPASPHPSGHTPPISRQSSHPQGGSDRQEGVRSTSSTHERWSQCRWAYGPKTVHWPYGAPGCHWYREHGSPSWRWMRSKNVALKISTRCLQV